MIAGSFPLTDEEDGDGNMPADRLCVLLGGRLQLYPLHSSLWLEHEPFFRVADPRPDELQALS